MELTAFYSSPDDKTGCKVTVNRLEDVSVPFCVGVKLPIVRNGEEYSTTLIVDKFLPGKCRWHFTSVAAKLSKNGVESIANSIIYNTERITKFEDSSESEFYNSKNIPVTWGCRFSRLHNLSPGHERFACDELSGKSLHALNHKTNSVRADFIDLEKDD